MTDKQMRKAWKSLMANRDHPPGLLSACPECGSGLVWQIKSLPSPHEDRDTDLNLVAIHCANSWAVSLAPYLDKHATE